MRRELLKHTADGQEMIVPFISHSFAVSLWLNSSLSVSVSSVANESVGLNELHLI